MHMEVTTGLYTADVLAEGEQMVTDATAAVSCTVHCAKTEDSAKSRLANR